MHQLIYSSAATHSICPQELDELLVRGRWKNEQAGITGLLLYHDRTFLQAIEGESRVVKSLYQRIRLDPRHADATILSQADVNERRFSGWPMAMLNADCHPLWALPGFEAAFGQWCSFSEIAACRTLAAQLLTKLRHDRLWRESVDTGERSAVHA